MPDDALALSNRCATHHRLGNLQQAFADADRAVQLRPDDPRMLSNRGDMHRVLGRYDEARGDLKRALQIRPDHVRAWMYLGQTEVARGATRSDVGSADVRQPCTLGARLKTAAAAARREVA